MEWMCKIDQSVVGADEAREDFQGRLHRSGNGYVVPTYLVLTVHSV